MRISDWSSDVCSSDRAALVDRLADHVHDATKRFRADRHADLRAGVGDLLTPDKAVGAIHGGGADGVLAERSEERRVGKEWVSRCKTQWSPNHYKKKAASIKQKNQTPK